MITDEQAETAALRIWATLEGARFMDFWPTSVTDDYKNLCRKAARAALSAVVVEGRTWLAPWELTLPMADEACKNPSAQEYKRLVEEDGARQMGVEKVEAPVHDALLALQIFAAARSAHLSRQTGTGKPDG